MSKAVQMITVVFVSAFLFAAGCAEKPKAGEAGMAPGAEAGKGPGAGVDEAGLGDVPKSVEESAALKDIHFDFDKSVITDVSKETLKTNAEWLKKNGAKKIQIEGHCDERGTNEYNLALGDRRASSAKNYLALLGIDAKRVSTVSYGEEKPLCTQQTEDCWTKNRRGHFVVVTK